MVRRYTGEKPLVALVCSLLGSRPARLKGQRRACVELLLWLVLLQRRAFGTTSDFKDYCYAALSTLLGIVAFGVYSRMIYGLSVFES